jgi:hypothetical protein
VGRVRTTRTAARATASATTISWSGTIAQRPFPAHVTFPQHLMRRLLCRQGAPLLRLPFTRAFSGSAASWAGSELGPQLPPVVPAGTSSAASALPTPAPAGAAPGLGGWSPSPDGIASLNPDQPYPIWFFDPEGPWYAGALSVARVFAGMLEDLHTVTGMPWWATVVASSLLVRVVYFPVNCYSLRNSARFFDAKDDIQALQQSHRAAVTALVGACPRCPPSWRCSGSMLPCCSVLLPPPPPPASLLLCCCTFLACPHRLKCLRLLALQGPAATTFEKFSLMRVYMGGAHAALRKHNCYPWRTFATPLMMMPLFFASVSGARHLVMMGDESFESGSWPLWAEQWGCAWVFVRAGVLLPVRLCGHVSSDAVLRVL